MIQLRSSDAAPHTVIFRTLYLLCRYNRYIYITTIEAPPITADPYVKGIIKQMIQISMFFFFFFLNVESWALASKPPCFDVIIIIIALHGKAAAQ